jgi:hypothetical protein
MSFRCGNQSVPKRAAAPTEGANLLPAGMALSHLFDGGFMDESYTESSESH